MGKSPGTTWLFSAQNLTRVKSRCLQGSVCDACSLLAVHLNFQTIHTAWLWPPSVIFIVSTSRSVPSHALNHSCFFHLYIPLPFCLPFPSLKVTHSCTGYTQITQGTLAKVCELLSLCRVPLSRDNIFSGNRDQAMGTFGMGARDCSFYHTQFKEWILNHFSFVWASIATETEVSNQFSYVNCLQY